LTSWKDYITRHWKSVKVLEMDVFDTDNFPLELGEQFTATIKLDINDFSAEDLGIELVFFKRIEDDELDLKRTKELDLVEQNGNIATYSCTYVVNNVGVYEYGFRLFPKNELLPHRQDFNLVRWL
ncbi:MAG: DUF3417 domain-containing protein, partial [Bacteroidetes bacterium]|nr:DUF3417 domain-containing protein [Bacteroidota bacterium]